MPSAEELASQRAREEECERALLRLREEHDAADREVPTLFSQYIYMDIRTDHRP